MNATLSAQATVFVDCPHELLLETHASPEEFSLRIKKAAAYEMFRNGEISSGLAAKWLNLPRSLFLLTAMQQGARLLDQGDMDFQRETSLL